MANPESETSGPEAAATFGFRRVGIDEKQSLVDDVFHQVARRYDVMNDVMSGGMHRIWKDAFVGWLSPPSHKRARYKVVDVAGGTGDIAARIARRSDFKARVTVCDINPSMLEAGRERAVGRDYEHCVDFVEGNAEELPFEDNRFDAYTIAFGLRNVPRLDKALSEAFRVLRPGGRFLCLEFSTVDIAGLDRFYELYSFNVIPAMGRVIAGDGEPYRYLVESIRQFPAPERLKRHMADAGFGHLDVRLLSGGIAAMHSGWKL